MKICYSSEASCDGGLARKFLPFDSWSPSRLPGLYLPSDQGSPHQKEKCCSGTRKKFSDVFCCWEVRTRKINRQSRHRNVQYTNESIQYTLRDSYNVWQFCCDDIRGDRSSIQAYFLPWQRCCQSLLPSRKPKPKKLQTFLILHAYFSVGHRFKWTNTD